MRSLLLRAVVPLWCMVLVWAAPAIATAQAYLIQPGDRLEVLVLEDSSLNRAVLVGPDGRISVPLAGIVEAAGRTTEAVQATIRSRLARNFVEPPTVTVDLVAVRDPEVFQTETPVSIYVIGQVARPGVYEVRLPLDILQALALAGGPGTFAARNRVQVRRRTEAGETVLLFDYEQLERGGVPATPIQLLRGDVIVVPERRLFE